MVCRNTRDREDYVNLVMEVFPNDVPLFPIHLGPKHVPFKYLGESSPIVGESRRALDWA
jgi:hypothetical protein